MAAVLDQAAPQISRQHEANQPRTPLLPLPDLLRNATPPTPWPWALPPWFSSFPAAEMAGRMAEFPVHRRLPAHQYC